MWETEMRHHMAQFGKEKEREMEEDDWWEDKASDYRLFKDKKVCLVP